MVLKNLAAHETISHRLVIIDKFWNDVAVDEINFKWTNEIDVNFLSFIKVISS